MKKEPNILWQLFNIYRTSFEPDQYFIVAYTHYRMLSEQLPLVDVLDSEFNMAIKAAMQDLVSSSSCGESIDKLFPVVAANFHAHELAHALTEVDNFVYTKYDAPSEATTDSISNLAIKLLALNKDDRSADFCSGIGNVLLKFADYGVIQSTGVEISVQAHLLSCIRAQIYQRMHPQISINLVNDDIFSFSKNNTDVKFDKIFSEFPWGYRTLADSDMATWTSPLVQTVSIPMNSDWRFISLVMSHLDAKGKAAIVVPMGIDFRKPDEDIRRYFIKNGFIERIIKLPAGILGYTGIEVNLMVLSYGNKEITFVDATQNYSRSGRQVFLSDADINSIVDEKISSHCAVELDEVLAQGRLDASFYTLERLENSLPLRDLAEIINGTVINKEDLDLLITNDVTGYELVRSKHLDDGMINGSDYLKQMPHKHVKLLDKDIVITRVGSRIDCAMYSDVGVETAIDSNLIIIRCRDTSISPMYLLAYLQSEVGRSQLQVLYTGVSIARISKLALGNLPVPIMPMPKQMNIGAEYNALNQKIEAKQLELEIVQELKGESLNAWFGGITNA